MNKLSKNFSLNEFACRDENNTPVPDKLMPNLEKLVWELQILRDYLGEPIHINSGYRTPEHNSSIGGTKNSQHLYAKAADITVKSKTPKQLKAIVEKLIKNGTLNIKGIGLYAGFIHVDIRKFKARW